MLKSNYIFLIGLLVCFASNLLSQHDISKYEKCWAVWHPFAAFKIKRRLNAAMIVYREVKESKQLDGFESGGTLDAFRHSFSMAYLSQRIKVKKLRKLGIAHEKGNKLHFYKNRTEFGERADSLACEMDLRNNELGFLIGANNKKMKIEELKLEMILQIKKGNAWILRRNSENEYVSCENRVIMLDNYKNEWFLPKCLSKSND